ncbi:MAG: M3 family oligoendopeptidase [Parasporobacterium sp.]|nr:M3 family oligoendopeptidase [Parasporobacterium sp.]
MKFSEIKYERPDVKKAMVRIRELTQAFSDSDNYESAREMFLEKEKITDHVMTFSSLASIRHSIDTGDEFYDAEDTFWQNTLPEFNEYIQNWTLAMLDSPFRNEFSEEYGDIVFINAEIFLKTFSPEIIGDCQKENQLVQAYEKLLASAEFDVDGKKYNISTVTPLKECSDDSLRLRAWKAEGQWYKDNQTELDRLYDELVHTRDGIGRKLGYNGYTELGYYRMGRNCWTAQDIDVFRKAVVKYLVPVAEQIYRDQAERLGKEYPMSFADNALSFRTGNPMPCCDAEGILNHARKFYDELSPETSEFFSMMLDNELMDVLSRDRKQVGGYCTSLYEYKCPFIFANFNGTQGDVEVVTHEAGHAFADWYNRDRIPTDTVWPTMEACEVHSMSMEFFSWPWAEGFFGKDTRKFCYSHLAAAIKFIPYGTMVDHFQHIVYEKPEMSPAERHGVWKELLGVYMPWIKLDGDIPFYSEGEGWQRQHHIYSLPFYYIDYCLAQTVSLEFWGMIMEDREKAWKHYMAYTRQGGSRVFTELLANAGLSSPFDENTLKTVCEKAVRWLNDNNISETEVN